MALARTGVLLLLFAPSLLAAEPAVDVYCPAVSYDDHHDCGRNGPSGPRPITLMVKGRTVLLESDRIKTKDRQNVHYGEISEVDLVIEEVLFGPLPGAKIRVDAELVGLELLQEPQSRLLSLTGGAGGKYSLDNYYAYDRTLEMLDEKGARALARARLDVHVLDCPQVFVGRGLGTVKTEFRQQDDLFGDGGEQFTKVKVERVLYGTHQVGDEVFLRKRSSDGESKDNSESMLYLVSGRETRDYPKSQAYYPEFIRWPLAMLDTVQASLARRTDYPVRDFTDEYGQQQRTQEILFVGPRADAIEMLGSENEAIRYLATRRLMHDGKAAIPDLLAVIEKHLWSDATEPERTFRRQKMLIDGLGALEDHQSDGHVARLIDGMLTKAESGATFPPRREVDDPRARFRRYDELDEASNHSLAWLLLTLPEADAARLFGRRLLKLRDVAAYGWKDEAQFVLDSSHIEDHLECAPLLPEARERQPRRWSAGIDGNDLVNYQVAFSPDGKFLAAAGNSARVWSTSDWRTLAQLDHDGGVNALCFSPNSNYLYIGGGGSIPVASRWNWRERRLEMRYQGLDGAAVGMQISPGADYLWTSDREQTIIYIPTTGKAQLKLSDRSWQQIRFAPTGKRCLLDQGGVWYLSTTLILRELEKLAFLPLDVAWAGPDEYWSLEENEAAKPLPPEAPGDDDNLFGPPGPAPPPGSPALSPVGVPAPGASGDLFPAVRPGILRLRSVASQKEVLREIPLAIAARQLLASRDGQVLVALSRRHVEVVSLPAGKPSGSWAMPQPKRDSRDVVYALSPDGRSLVMGSAYEYPRLIDVATGKQMLLGQGHVDPITSLKFFADGQELVSMDDGGGECRWRAESGERVTRRAIAPPVPTDDRNLTPDRIDEQGVIWRFGEERVHRYSAPSAFEVRTTPPNSKRGAKGKLIGKIESRWGQYQPVDLVPGGKYLHVGTQIFSRSDLKPISAQNVSGDINLMAFSQDGSRYALLTSEAEFRPTALGMDVRERHEISQMLRVHDTLTGKPLFCQPLEHHLQLIALSPDGRQVAGVNKRQEIEVWTVGREVTGGQ